MRPDPLPGTHPSARLQFGAVVSDALGSPSLYATVSLTSTVPRVALVTRCFETLKAECPRVSVSLRADYRAGPAGRLKSKVARIEERLGRTLST